MQLESLTVPAGDSTFSQLIPICSNFCLKHQPSDVSGETSNEGKNVSDVSGGTSRDEGKTVSGVSGETSRDEGKTVTGGTRRDERQ